MAGNKLISWWREDRNTGQVNLHGDSNLPVHLITKNYKENHLDRKSNATMLCYFYILSNISDPSTLGIHFARSSQ